MRRLGELMTFMLVARSEAVPMLDALVEVVDNVGD